MLFLSRSSDRGATWSDPVDVSLADWPFPSLAVGVDGTLGFVATVPGTLPGSTEAAFFHSADGGDTWARTPVDGPFPREGLGGAGYYQETAPTPTGFVAVFPGWGEAMDGGRDAFVARITKG